ncbi:Zinc (Zn2)-Iron (Fe2) Permease (ZIP) Family [Phytophthora infestans T30-4]|uniref:Zinc (Zn2 )-Iron (Fe2 ) Permease (ZIP) Family n=2 Tax=Phytophthora infestans TaxID=4787 RepID=D0N2P7_PHYIT|nr:Zinc (Zn2)-Iron (Fe2) Permease (ZIP) Family [Phytophthora infestans T30-4]XP_002909816.1 Zinc (Zn2)-Iron (Fe2) Permease (ZIP) Family [Phytophthora infestans T30-4]KAF4035400.1 ZIP Zinc transporter [Phytophthora infestans]EEY61751.1 Zinc (Zn2)-Iron (Fe2) Permease (ZIP) Family [Phytophthora infestans T30-4]EEY68576.1 Zinc (Zn2)-Iron (Fe2) Permease (ZIP) Family [Phytophthora infestans T30-4]KAF4134657.1 ZIP Zinc transporter [Phytophthora infestans]KAF4145138.1 ZIP Zinc transporter [Phytophtho|eukprot:XP_002905735.1 Zinc (Zn2)-Iron (Fe2) Permease (ZIP) Family [Phytophthora infestans T30-4]
MAIEEESSLDLTPTFGLNALAALATVLGGCVIFSNKLLQLASPMFMAVLLSVSAGITIFQALVVLFANSFKEFNDAFSLDDNESNSSKDDEDQGNAWLAATGCFGGGILVSYIVDFIVQKLTPGQNMNGTARMQPERLSFEEGTFEVKPPVELVQNQGSDVFIKMDEAAKEKLQRMGILSAIAVGIHNIPEGMATFVASSEHAWIGLSLAIGVALHNLAEGIAVATPIYFATGSTCRGLLWCFLSAVAQHIGGIIAFASLGMDADNETQGILYGLCAGMLCGISMKEIIPTAYMYANGRMHLVSAGTLGGMLIMSSGLIFFKYVGV